MRSGVGRGFGLAVCLVLVLGSVQGHIGQFTEKELQTSKKSAYWAVYEAMKLRKNVATVTPIAPVVPSKPPKPVVSPKPKPSQPVPAQFLAIPAVTGLAAINELAAIMHPKPVFAPNFSAEPLTFLETAAAVKKPDRDDEQGHPEVLVRERYRAMKRIPDAPGQLWSQKLGVARTVVGIVSTCADEAMPKTARHLSHKPSKTEKKMVADALEISQNEPQLEKIEKSVSPLPLLNEGAQLISEAASDTAQPVKKILQRLEDTIELSPVAEDRKTAQNIAAILLLYVEFKEHHPSLRDSFSSLGGSVAPAHWQETPSPAECSTFSCLAQQLICEVDKHVIENGDELNDSDREALRATRNVLEQWKKEGTPLFLPKSAEMRHALAALVESSEETPKQPSYIDPATGRPVY